MSLASGSVLGSSDFCAAGGAAAVGGAGAAVVGGGASVVAGAAVLVALEDARAAKSSFAFSSSGLDLD